MQRCSSFADEDSMNAWPWGRGRRRGDGRPNAPRPAADPGGGYASLTPDSRRRGARPRAAAGADRARRAPRRCAGRPRHHGPPQTPAAPAGRAMPAPRKPPAHSAARTLAEIAGRAGCRLTEFDHDPISNPPVSGRVDERIYAPDGSYVGRRSPSTLATVHALLHGRVVFQYRRDVSAAEIAPLQRLVRRRPSRTLLLANRTRMRDRVAATAYLTLMTCPRVDARTMAALAAFRDRRVAFGQAF